MTFEINEEKENKMGTVPINKLLVSMSAPICISMLVQAMYNIVDSIFVSRVSENALTAISLSFPIQNLMIAVSIGTGIGVNALLSKSLGEKNIERVNKTAHNGIILAVFSYIVFLFLGIFFVRPFFESQTDIVEVINLGVDYLSVCLIFSFGLFGHIIFERLLQSTGKTFYNMIAQSTGAITNIILDPILIFGLFGMPKLSIKGAAIATVIGQLVGMFMAIYFNLTKNKEIDFNKKYFKLEKDLVKSIYIVGIPSMVVQTLASLMIFVLNGILITFSSTATAAFGIYFKLQSFIFMPVFGLINGMVPIISFNYGARNKERIIKTIKSSIFYALIIMGIGTLLFQIFPNKFLSIFKASDEMMKIGVPMLRIISSTYLCAGFSIICGSVFQAFGNGIFTLIISIERQLVVIIPVAYLLSKYNNVNLVWLAFPISDLIAVVLSFLFLKHIYRKILMPMPILI